jgi:glycosyltransferase involved in cell wall biosynthesis
MIFNQPGTRNPELRIQNSKPLQQRIILTVTNDLTYDQRMQRIAATLADAGYAVELVGRALPHSLPLDDQPFTQRRLRCRFRKGILFYAEFNLRLFAYLMRARFDAVGTVDFDTLPAGALAGWLRRKKRVFDAHEYFTEVPEVQGRRLVKAFWAGIGRIFLPLYRHAYTVGPALAELFSRKYGLPFAVVRNVPLARPELPASGPPPAGRVILYQGALNEGRGLEAALEALTRLDGVELWLAGEGDLSARLRRLAGELKVENKARFLGFVKPSDLKDLTSRAWLGINLLENRGLSYYFSLANKFFDYVQAGVPVLTMDFPEYRALNRQYEVALLLPGLEADGLAQTIRRLLDDPALYSRLQANCCRARLEWTWENERAMLLEVWKQALQPGKNT